MYRSIFYTNKATPSYYSNNTRSLKTFSELSVAQQIAKLLNKIYGLKTFLRSVKNSCAGNSVYVGKECTV